VFFSINWRWYVESARWVSTISSKPEMGKIELFKKIICENDVGYFFSFAESARTGIIELFNKIFCENDMG
jgi:hypothetical protein